MATKTVDLGSVVGPPGPQGATPAVTASATVDSSTGTPSVTVTRSGTDESTKLAFAFSGLKGEDGKDGSPGAKGDPGVASASAPLSLTSAGALSIRQATASQSGYMSAADKKKLDGVETGANKTVVDIALSSTSTNPVQNKVVNAALGKKASTSHTHTAATQSAAGFMSAADKKKLDALPDNGAYVTLYEDPVTADPSSAPPKNSVQLSESAEGFDLLVVTLGALASAPGCAFTLDLASQADDIAGGKTFAVLAPVTAWWMNNRMVVGTIVVDGPSVSVSVEKMYSFGSDGLVLDDSLSDFVGIVRVAGVRT